MAKKSVPFSQDPHEVRLTKEHVLGRMAEGLYLEFPEQWVPDATGYTLDPWQNNLIRTLFLGNEAVSGDTILDWKEEKKARLSCKASHGTGKCNYFKDLAILSNGTVVPYGDLIGKNFKLPSIDENFQPIEVDAFATDNGIESVWKITLLDGREITRTGNHPLYHIPANFRAGRNPIFGKQNWVAVTELKPNDLLCIPEYLHVDGTLPMEDWQVILLGHVIGDGCVSVGTVKYSQFPGAAQDEMRKIVTDLGLKFKDGSHKGDFSITAERGKFNCVLDLVRSLGIYGRKSGDHMIPNRLWQIPNNQLKIFLSRLFSADGWACLHNAGKKANGEKKIGQEIGYVSKSERLVRDVHLALLRFGVSGRIRKTFKHWTHKGIKKSNYYWTWTITDSRNVIRFIREIGIYGKEEACEKVFQNASREFNSNRISGGRHSKSKWQGDEKRALKWPHEGLTNDFRWEKIKSIEYVGEELTVAITVPETNTYLTTFVEHNSFMAGILTNMFMGLYVPSRVAITGPTGKQTRAQVWNYISAVWNRSVFKEDIDWYRTTMSYKINPGEWFATWLTSKEPKSIEGFHGPENGENLLWIVEESKGVADGVFEAIQGALSAKNNYWYISSTCGTAHGFFFDTFHSKKELWDNISVPYYDSTRISLQQVKKWEKTWGKDSSIFKARVLAEFPDESDKIICPLSWYERAIVRNDEDDELDEVA